MQDLHITFIQTSLSWEDKAANLSQFTDKIAAIGITDLIVLPEMFTTGFSMRPEALAEEMNGESMQWMKDIAHQRDCVITGSIIIMENGKYYNRQIWMQADGTFSFYDKRHLFRMGNEHIHYTAGEKQVVASVKGWKVCLSICYDLRFPVWYRNTQNKGNGMEYDCLLCVANWPERRSFAWKTLLQARAIENQVYVVGVNRVGEDGNGMYFSGDSAVISPHGEKLSKTLPHQENVEQLTLSYQELADFRKSFPVGLDGDTFEIKP